MVHNHAVLWNHGKVRDLGLLKGFPFSAARGINRSGQIVGGWDLNYRPGGGGGPAGLRQTFVWRDGRMTILGNESPPNLDFANAINDSGQVAGTAEPDEGFHAVLWTESKAQTLPLPAGFTETRAYALNDAGMVVGSAAKDNGHGLDYHGILWRKGKAIDLGMIPYGGAYCEAFGINNQGQITGSSNGRAFLWQNGKMQDLGLLSPGYPYSVAHGINNHGQIVGEANNASPKSHAFLWQKGTLYDLNALIPTEAGWVLENARAINNGGQIVGWGQRGGKKRAFLLTSLPIPPAPATPAAKKL